MRFSKFSSCCKIGDYKFCRLVFWLINLVDFGLALSAFSDRVKCENWHKCQTKASCCAMYM